MWQEAPILSSNWNTGVRKGIDTLIDISRVACLNEIVIDEDEVMHLGPLVTFNHCVASKLVVERLFPLARAAWEAGTPQIRNRGTIAGNLITASPLTIRSRLC